MTIVAVGPEILVSTTIGSEQQQPRIIPLQNVALAGGGFAVTWMSSLDNGSHWDIRGRVIAADGTPVGGSDFLVSTNGTHQAEPQITALADGGFAVTWESFNIGSGSHWDVRGRVFAADGTPVNGSDFLVSTTNVSLQDSPQITALADGGFAVTWTSWDNGSDRNIRGRVFEADGRPVSVNDFLVSTANAGIQQGAQITALADGGFAVTWTSSDDGSDGDIRGRVFAADGTPVSGSDFLVPTTNAYDQFGPQIMALADGGFAVTWVSLYGSDYDIRGRVFACDGTPVNGSDFLVSTTNADVQTGPQITALADGGFAVTWYSSNNGSDYDIRGRVFAANGTPVNGSDFLVPTTNAYGQGLPQITALADGGFAVTWYSSNNGSDYDIHGRVFAIDGTPVGGDFLVSTSNAGNQTSPQITALSDGSFAVTWHSLDHGDYNVRGRVFAVNEAPAVTAPGGLATDEDTSLVINGFTVDDPDGSQLTVTLTAASTLTLSQTDGLAFTEGDGTANQKMTFSGAIADINAALAGMAYAPTADFNGTGGFDYTLDDGMEQISGSVAIKVDAVNDAPTITLDGGGAAASMSVAENTTAVTTVTATDPDAGQTLSYSIIGGADADKFGIDSNTGALRFIAPPNFEAPTDMGGNNRYDVIVMVSDGAGFIDTQAVAVTVTNSNDAPTITSNGGGATANVFVAENSTAVTMVTATDPDAGQATDYSIIGGADADKFGINSNTGELRFITAPNFEAPTDTGGNNRYDLTVRVSDGHGGTDTQAIAVTVTNSNEAPTITSNGRGATASVFVAENGTAVTMVTATDPDAGQAPSYSIIGGADANKFGINSNTGALRFITAPNFEAPTDIGGNNSYDVTVRVNDGHGGTDTQAIAVTVTNFEGGDDSGGAGDDTLRGGIGNDLLNGGIGADKMTGGAGNDTYVVDNAADKVIEAVAGGTDTVFSSVNYTLQVGQEVEFLRASAGTIGLTLVGNEFKNALVGGAGNDVLVGGAGADTMQGLAGNDIYVVDNVSDMAIEALGAGIDRVDSAVTFTLGANVENLTLTGAAAINGAGNTLANIIIGNGANNVLNGLAGVDSLQGGLGNDSYIVDHVSDQVVETAGAGTDSIVSSVTEVLTLNVENLTLTGTAAINGTGNTLNNVIIGNAANNILTGSSGNDSLNGSTGNDVLIGGGHRDIMTGGAGADDFDFNVVAEMGKTAATRDVITDFFAGDDIDLSTIDANGAAAGNTAFSFLATSEAAFTGAAGQLRWQNLSSLTLVEGDINGDRVADFQIQLTGLKTLTAADFIL